MRATFMYGAGDVRVIDAPTRRSCNPPTRWCG